MPNYTMTREDMVAALADLKKVYEGLQGSDLQFAKSLEQSFAVRGMLSDKQMYWARKMAIKGQDRMRAKATGQATSAPPRPAPPKPVTAADLIPDRMKNMSPAQLRQMVQELEAAKVAQLRDLERKRQRERDEERRREMERRREEEYWNRVQGEPSITSEPAPNLPEGLQELLDREFKERQRIDNNRQRVAIKAHEVEWQRPEKQQENAKNKEDFLLDLETAPTYDGGGEICTVCHVKGCRIGPMARY